MNNVRTKVPRDYGNTPQDAALRRQLAGIARMEEQSPVYQEMCAEADAKRFSESTATKAGNGHAVDAPKPPRKGRTHGLISTYNGGCRCAECRRGSTEYRSRMRANAKARALATPAETPGPPPGTPSAGLGGAQAQPPARPPSGVVGLEQAPPTSEEEVANG